MNWQAGQSLQQIISDWAREYPDRIPLMFLSGQGGEQRISYARLDTDVRRVAWALQEAGINPGDLVVVVLPHSYEQVAAFIGAIYYGAVPSIFADHNLQPEAYQGRAQALIRASGARAILTLPNGLQALGPSIDPAACKVILFPSLAEQANPMETWSGLSGRGGEDAAYIQFSSGTTGIPKGIVLSHRAVINSIVAGHTYQLASPSDTSIGWLPLYHDMGLVKQVLAPLLYGGLSCILHPAHWLRRPITLFQAIDRYKATTMWMPNFAFRYCTRRLQPEDLRGLDLSSIRIIGNGSEAVSWKALQDFAAHFAPYGLPKKALKVGYGMAENVLAISITPPDREATFDWVSRVGLQTEGVARQADPQDEGAIPIASCGYRLPGMEVQITDEQGVQLPERVIGEVLVSSPALFSGYYRQPDLTEAVLQDGWLHTGDLGYLADGQLYIHGRKKDLIIVGGQNIQPHVLEEIASVVIGANAGRVVAFGLENAQLGTELPVLVCEVRGLDDIALRENLSRQIRSRVLQDTGIAMGDVRLVKRGWVAVTTSGKNARLENRQKYINVYGELSSEALAPPGSLSDVAPQTLTVQISQIFQEILGASGVGLDENFFALGGDSLSALRLTLMIEERIGHEVPVEFFQEPTIAHLVHLLEQTQVKGHPIDADAASKSISGPRLQIGKRANLLAGRGHWLSELAFRLRVHALAWLCGQNWFQNRYYPEQVRLVKEFYAALQNPLPNLEQTIMASLVNNIARKWKHPVISSPRQKSMDDWVQVQGLDHYTRALKDGKGVILATSHSLAPHILRRVIRVSQHTVYYLVRRMQTPVSDSVPGKKIRSSFHSSQMVRAYRVLQQGGTVVLAADGSGGTKAALEVLFHGRMRRFMGGLGELARTTSAAVIPVFVSLDLRWHATIKFFPPLQQTTQRHGKTYQDALMMEYVQLLEAYWSEQPASLPWRVMKQHLSRQLPAGDSAQEIAYSHIVRD